jgi:hypothetical protein
MNTTTDLFGPVIHRYTRAQALADGVLVDAAPLAAEAGFTVPVALTAEAWAHTVTWDEANTAAQDETGRLWDVLTMTRLAAGRATPGQTRVIVQLIRVPNRKNATRPTPVLLHAHIGPGDHGEPVLTIMRPHET